jgi:hypothetical protein
MNRIPFVLALIIILTAVQRVEIRAETAQKLISVSLLQLIVAPENYDGKLIGVIGFLSMGREGDLLFAHQEDERHVILGNAVQVHETKQMHQDIEKLDNKYVKITGTFHANNRERIPFFSGAVTEVRSCDLWSDPLKPLSDKFHNLTTSH